MKNLNEGMRSGDLEGLVLPLVSIDEYESKIDPEAIVLSFFVQDKNAAQDLNRFLQKSNADLLDTDVSPAPDQHGYFVVFVETLKTHKLPKIIMQLLYEISMLTNFSKWKIRIRGVKKLVDANEEILNKLLNTIGLTENLINFFKSSDIVKFVVDDGNLLIEDVFQRAQYEFIGYGSLNKLLVENKLLEAGMKTSKECRNLSTMLGRNWDVSTLDDYLIIQKHDEDNVVIVKS